MSDQFRQCACANCNELYGRIRRANQLAVAVRPVLDRLHDTCTVTLSLDERAALKSAFDLYAAVTLSAEVRAAVAAEPPPVTERSR